MKVLSFLQIIGFLFIGFILIGKHFGFAKESGIFLFYLLVLSMVIYIFEIKQNGKFF